jgi:hypothetical protein
MNRMISIDVLSGTRTVDLIACCEPIATVQQKSIVTAFSGRVIAKHITHYCH